MYSLIAAHAAVFKLHPDVRADPQQIRSYTRPGHEPSSTSPTVLRGAARKLHSSAYQLFIKCIEVIGR